MSEGRTVMPAHTPQVLHRAPMAHSKVDQLLTSHTHGAPGAMSVPPLHVAPLDAPRSSHVHAAQVKREPIDTYDYSKVIEISDDSDGDDDVSARKMASNVTSDSEVDDIDEAREVYNVFNLQPPVEVTSQRPLMTSRPVGQGNVPAVTPINIIPQAPAKKNTVHLLNPPLPVTMTQIAQRFPVSANQRPATATPLFIVQPPPIMTAFAPPTSGTAVAGFPGNTRMQRMTTMLEAGAMMWTCPHCSLLTRPMTRSDVTHHMRKAHPHLPPNPVPWGMFTNQR